MGSSFLCGGLSRYDRTPARTSSAKRDPCCKFYGHYDLSDLERAMDALAKARHAEAEEPAD